MIMPINEYNAKNLIISRNENQISAELDKYTSAGTNQQAVNINEQTTYKNADMSESQSDAGFPLIINCGMEIPVFSITLYTIFPNRVQKLLQVQ